MTEYPAVDGSRIAYEVAGSGPPTVDALRSGHGRLYDDRGRRALLARPVPGQVVSLMLSSLQPHAARA
jgi:hypothetical protein